MTDTIIDMIRVPVEENGAMKYDFDTIKNLYEGYMAAYPNHSIFVMPADIKIWEDLDILEIESIVNYLTEVLKKKKGIDE